MGIRTDLHTLLTGVFTVGNVYFQPPTSTQIQYPCIVYQRSGAVSEFADNVVYQHMLKYQVTVISKDPDESVLTSIAHLPHCSYVTHFTSDNLHHDVFEIWF